MKVAAHKKKKKKLPVGCGRPNASLIVFIEEHLIQSFILSKYKTINVLSCELYKGDPDLYWSFTLYSFNKVANL